MYVTPHKRYTNINTEKMQVQYTYIQDASTIYVHTRYTQIYTYIQNTHTNLHTFKMHTYRHTDDEHI